MTAAADRMLFELEAASFGIGGRTLLEPLTLALPSQEIVGLIGHNGSGKSTLLKLLARHLPLSGGTIRFRGRLLPEWGNREFARKVAYLPQHPPPAAGMLTKELVALGRYPWHGALGRFGKTDREKVEEAIALTGVTAFADRLVDTLSGGERQRVWLAMLMAQDPECLLLDEPISALDINHQMEVMSLVRRLSHDRQLSVIVVLHDVNVVARFCDSVIALQSGAMIAAGSPGHIMTSNELKRIYGIDMTVLTHPNTGAPVAIPC
ncbi:ATP-binding cassette domain-containing protein [Pseudochelatococcus sp. B33]